MAHVLDDRVKETTTTTGTGQLTLGGAVSNFQTFAAAPMANNDTTLYVIQHTTAAEWEVGVGTWLTGGLLARTTILGSSNANAVVNLSAGTKHVAMTLTPSGPWPLVRLSDGGVIHFDSLAGTHPTLTHFKSGTDSLTIANSSLITAASVATRHGFQLTSGTLMTTPAVGGIEHDATNFYGTTDVGNRGYIPLRHYIRTAANRTYTSNTTAQPIFNVPTNGRFTLETGSYRFEAVLVWSTMSATSGNRSVDILGAGTATVNVPRWIAIGFDGAAGTAGAAGISYMTTNASPASVVTATIGTGLGVYIAGQFELTVAGTMIPSTTMVTAAASVLTINSVWAIERVGATGATFVGQVD